MWRRNFHVPFFHPDVKKADYSYVIFMGRYSLLLTFQPVRRSSAFSHQTLYPRHHLCVCVVQVAWNTNTHKHTSVLKQLFLFSRCFLLPAGFCTIRTSAEVFIAVVSVELCRLCSAIIVRCEKLIRGRVVSGFHSNLESSVARVFQDVPAFRNKDCFLNSASD